MFKKKKKTESNSTYFLTVAGFISERFGSVCSQFRFVGLVDDHVLLARVDVVREAEVLADAVHEHAIVTVHRGKLVHLASLLVMF